VASVSDRKTKRTTENEDIVFVVLVNLEQFGVSLGEEELLRKWMRFSVNDNVVHVIKFNFVFSSQDLDSKLVIGDLLTQNDVPWLVSTVSGKEGVALRDVSVVGVVVVGLDGVRGDVTVGIDSEIEGGVHEARESGVNLPLEWSWQEGQVDSVEVFLLSLRSMPVDVGGWVFLVHCDVYLDFSLQVSITSNSVMTMSSVTVNSVAGDGVWHEEGSSQGSWIPPSVARIRVDLVGDGDVRLTESSLLEGSPETWVGGWSDVIGG